MVTRREFLIGGAAFTAFAVAARSQLKTAGPAIDPRSHGAHGDGLTDDTQAIQAALRTAFGSGVAVDGGDAVFAVSGDIDVRRQSSPHIKSLRLRQLDPQQNRKTLHFSNCDGIRIDRLQIDVGRSRPVGYMNQSGGLWIHGGSNHDVRNVEVFGDGKNSLIAIWNTSNSSYSNFRAHDAHYDDPAATNDQLQGILMQKNTDCVLQSPIVSRLSGNANPRFPYRFTRGIALGGNLRVRVVDADVSNVDQGIDWTGTDGNTGCETVRGKVYQCTTAGHKHGDSAVRCRATSVVAERCGTHGFLVAAGGDPHARQKTSFVDLVDCVALDVGALHVDFSDSRFGFSIEGKSREPHYPQGCRFIRCRATDTQAAKTMLYGFYDNITYDPATTKPNQLIDCSSQGAIRGAKHGDWR